MTAKELHRHSAITCEVLYLITLKGVFLLAFASVSYFEFAWIVQRISREVDSTMQSFFMPTLTCENPFLFAIGQHFVLGNVSVIISISGFSL
jgi:hypothetical protein